MSENKKEENRNRFLTGCDLLDVMVGGGLGEGFPTGKIVNIVGDKSTGKTFLLCEIMAWAYYFYGKKLKIRFDNCESGFTFDIQYLYGFDIKKQTCRSETVEQLSYNFMRFAKDVKEDEFGIYGVDSLDGLTSEQMQDRIKERFKAYEKGKDFSKGSYQMGKPKFLSQEFFPPVADIIEKKNILLVIISQTRDKIDSMFKQQTRAGGKALDFYAHTVLWLSQLKKIKKRDRSIGVVVKAKTTKSKTPRPYRTCMFTLLFDYGLDNIGSNIDYLFDLRSDNGTLLSNANEIIWQGDNVSLTNLKEFLAENNLAENYKNEYKTFKKSNILEYIEGDEERKEKFDRRFGVPLTREESINKIENNKELEKELTKRVKEKWERIEQEIKPDRKKKYR